MVIRANNPSAVPVLAALIPMILLAGCLGGTAPAGPPANVGSTPSPEPTEPNRDDGLLGLLPKPAKVSRVSDGGEPLTLADRNGKFLWIADTSGIYYSLDNGTRWQETAGYTADFSAAFIDGPGLAQDEKGRLYAATLHDNRGDVARSDDGKSFTQAAYFAGYPIDRPWIAARGDTVVVVYLNNLGVVGTQEACTRSTDAGATFVDRNPISGNHGTGGIYMAPDKSFYFTGDNGIITRHAQTCGDTTSFSGSTTSMFTSVGVNNLYAMTGEESKLFAAAAGSGNKMQVSGLSKWGARPVVYTVSPPELKTNTFGTVAARGNDVAVAWYGSTSAGDPSAEGFSGTFDVYVALIRDYFGEESEPTIQLWKASERSNHRGQICMGGITCTGARGLLDYFGVAFDIWGGIHVSYVDDTSSTTTYHAHIVPEGEGAPIGEPVPVPTGPSNPTSTSRPTSLPPGGADRPIARIQGEIRGLRLTLNGNASTGTQPLSFEWDVGDGTTREGAAIDHTYAQAGDYTVRLTVRDAHGREGSASAQIQAVEGASGEVAGDGGSKGTPAAGLVWLLGACLIGLIWARRR